MAKKIKLVNGMDQSNLEDAVSAAIEKRLGMPATIFESSNYGVIAIERLTGSHDDRIDWQELAAELARTTGIGVTCIANCDWSFDDSNDEEATFIAFACPSVPEGYRDDPNRNLISAVDPATAPAQEDFDNLKRAKIIVDDHLRELGARRLMLVTAKKDERETVGRIEAVSKLTEMEAEDRAAVKAVLDLDFDRAVAALPAEAEVEAPAPRM